MTLDALRRYFPHTGHTLYVNHAATSPLSRTVMDAIDGYLGERHAAHPDAPIDNFEDFLPVLHATKQRVAELLGTEAGRVALVQNTSSALNLLARGLDWQPGDRIAVPACEFPANVYPFLNLRHRGVEIDFIPHEEGTFTVAAIEAALKPDTRLLTLSWVQFLSGFRTDLEAVGALCDAYDILFCVDAIQGLGALELDVEAAGVDFLAAGGHKWLMATQGVGVLYCAPSVQEQLHPPAGWLHGPVDWDRLVDYELTFHPGARRFETGTRNNVGVAALNAALGLYQDTGPGWCQAQVLARSERLAQGLEVLGYRRYGSSDPAHASGIVAVHAEASAPLLAHLAAHHITASVRNGKLRFSPTYYNTPAEIDRILEVVASFDPSAASAQN